MTGTIGLSPALMSKPACVRRPLQYRALCSSRSRRSVVAETRSSTFSVAATMTEASVLEKRYGRARWRHSSTISLRPLTQPPEAPPSALPNVVVMTSIFPSTPKRSGVPAPVLPIKPEACEASTKAIVSCFAREGLEKRLLGREAGREMPRRILLRLAIRDLGRREDRVPEPGPFPLRLLRHSGDVE